MSARYGPAVEWATEQGGGGRRQVSCALRPGPGVLGHSSLIGPHAAADGNCDLGQESVQHFAQISQYIISKFFLCGPFLLFGTILPKVPFALGVLGGAFLRAAPRVPP